MDRVCMYHPCVLVCCSPYGSAFHLALQAPSTTQENKYNLFLRRIRRSRSCRDGEIPQIKPAKRATDGPRPFDLNQDRTSSSTGCESSNQFVTIRVFGQPKPQEQCSIISLADLKICWIFRVGTKVSSQDSANPVRDPRSIRKICLRCGR